MKRILVLGSGKIGRGVIGSIFHEHGYELVFYDIATEFLKNLKEQGYYLVERLLDNDEREIVKVDNFQVLSQGTDEELQQALTEIDLVACCVYPGAFDSICGHIAEAIKDRIERNGNILNVLLCVNTINSVGYFNEKIEKLLIGNEKALQYFKEKVGISQVLVSIGAMPSSEELIKQDAFAVTTNFVSGSLGIDEDTYLGELELKYVHKEEKAQAKLIRKIFVANMKHCATAYMGYVAGYEYLDECLMDENIKSASMGAFMEAHEAVKLEYGFEDNEDKNWLKVSVKRANQLTRDPISRVAANVTEKISRENRFIGPALLCIKHNIVPVYIARGIASALFYQDKNDPRTLEMQEFIRMKGVAATIEMYCGLDPKQDQELIQLIIKSYDSILEQKQEVER